MKEAVSVGGLFHFKLRVKCPLLPAPPFGHCRPQ
jgi:hypothetical protein